ncbi:MAG: non-heme iron oxygenase ferredoxin subunit [Planctomycetota bacterium]|nr:MAG: non-heme iron oxygenase ferredoxin subunit [Planctomycetota bacterium]
MAWKKLGAADIPVGQGREFVVDGIVIAVFHLDDAWLAVDGMCAHQGGPLAQGHVDNHCVTCPWHGWQYDLRTGQNLLTGKKMLNTFPIEQRDGELWIDVPV